jgi:hypothetical protein
MKNYARKHSTPGKTAYRTPSRFRANRGIATRAVKAQLYHAGIKGRPEL